MMKRFCSVLILLAFGLALNTSLAAEGTNPKVVIETSMGDIQLELYADKAPQTVENFVDYVNEGFYDDTIFHRIIDRFMIQGGGFTQDYAKKTTKKPIQNEANNGLKNSRGTIAMARTQNPHSATAQFFINTVDNKFLDFTRETINGWGYTVFGKVIEGMDVVDRISKVKTGNVKIGDNGPVLENVPKTQIVIKKVRLVNASPATTE